MTSEWTLLQDTDRYGTNERKQRTWPEKIVVHGTLEQAQYVADMLSFCEPGCTDYWYVKEAPGNE
jgi:hypothetical protein